MMHLYVVLVVNLDSLHEVRLEYHVSLLQVAYNLWGGDRLHRYITRHSFGHEEYTLCLQTNLTR